LAAAPPLALLGAVVVIFIFIFLLLLLRID
jgi:hypothetical protein